MEDYAWSIQTLQALEEMCLTKVPRLAKKTWEEMASESNDDYETELQKQIQIAKQTKTISNPKGKQTMVQQDPTPKPANSYVSKNNFFFLFCRWSRSMGTRIPLRQLQKLSRRDSITSRRPSTKPENSMSSS